MREFRSVGICQYCNEVIVDGREDSGAAEYDPMTLGGGDFGCDESPETTEDGVGSHTLDALRLPGPKGKGADLDNDWETRTETFKVLV